MRQPPGFESSDYPSFVCKLNKALYGLKQAPRAWFDKLKTALQTKGFQNSISDSSLFIFKENSAVTYVLVYVDDILITGSNSTYITQLMIDLNDEFALKTLGSLQYFLGLEATRTSAGIHLKQTKYATDLLVKTNMLEAHACSTPMAVGTRLSSLDSPLFEQPSLYRSTVGALQYLTLTRPDISFPVNKLSQHLQAPTNLQWQACKRILRYIKGTLQFGLQFKPAVSLNIECYADADWGSSPDDRRSTSGCCVFLGPNLIQWSSRKQKVVALSSTEAEYRALAQTATKVAWLHNMFSELGLNFPITPVVWCDNVSVGALASNPVFHAQTKHIELDAHYIREQVLAKKLVVQYVPSKLQIADLLTKPLSAAQSSELRQKMTVLDGASVSSGY